jgi:hypothetical protein
MGGKQDRFMNRLPLFQGLRPFEWSGVSKNVLAGFTLAAMNIPQSLGYTKIAGTPIVTGLYTLLLPHVAFSLFGSSRFLVVAADSATAAILAGGLAGFFNNRQLSASFLGIARRAWTFYREEGLVDSVPLIEKARRVLEKHPVAPSAISDHEFEDWIDHRVTVAVNSPIDIIRSEDEAAIWRLMRSPSVRAGPYAKIDIGAGTTHANLFRIFGPAQSPKRSLGKPCVWLYSTKTWPGRRSGWSNPSERF